MILTDREIEMAIVKGQLEVDPPPTIECYSSTSLDLTLDQVIRVWKKSSVAGVTDRVLCPGKEGYSYQEIRDNFTERVVIEGESGFDIQPKSFVLAWTRERVSLPSYSRLAARVEGKSSLARIGIGVHVTAPTIHAGFDGAIQLEVFNWGEYAVKLVPGMRICQLIFEQCLGTPQKGYAGQFAKQSS